MKCPFRTTKIVKTTIGDNPFHPAYGKPVNVEESIEFQPCLGIDCPYFGKRELRHSQNGGYRQITNPVCRRAVES